MPWRLRAHPTPLRPVLEADAEAARQQAAHDLLNIEKVKAALLAAAKEGQQVCVFRPARPLDLRGTIAADTLRQWAEKEGLTLEWGQPETVSEGGFECGQRVAVAIRWEKPGFVL